jgi:predicted aspartyl protease
MIRAPLSTICGTSEYRNPAPVLTRVSLADLIGHKHPTEWPGIIDTGADVSVVPVAACNDLNLQPYDWAKPCGFSGRSASEWIPIYFICVQIDGLGEFPLRRVYGVQRANLLIGRDLLKSLMFLFNGHANHFELGRHTI